MIQDKDLLKLSDDELLDLHHTIVSHIEARQRHRQKKALSTFEAGDRVYFDDPEGQRHEGMILRVNQKSLTIRTDRSGTWRVGPSFVKKAKAGNVKGGQLFELRLPEHPSQ